MKIFCNPLIISILAETLLPLARLYPFQIKKRATTGPISGMAALSCMWFEVADRHKCRRRAAGVSPVKSLPHHVHGPAEALQPTAIGFGKMDKVELTRWSLV